MPVSQEVFVLSEPLGLEERRRTTGRGTKSRFTISVRTDPLIFNLSEISLGKKPALALQQAIQEGIRAIGEVASESTRLKRSYAASALAGGSRWAVRRYSGGRIGTTLPNQSDRLFNDSGRFARGIFARQNPQENSWTINVPANRLDPSTFPDQSRFLGMVEKLRSLVPAFGAPLSQPSVKRAIGETLDAMITKADDRNWQQKLTMIKQTISIAKQIADILTGG